MLSPSSAKTSHVCEVPVHHYPIRHHYWYSLGYEETFNFIKAVYKKNLELLRKAAEHKTYLAERILGDLPLPPPDAPAHVRYSFRNRLREKVMKLLEEEQKDAKLIPELVEIRQCFMTGLRPQ